MRRDGVYNPVTHVSKAIEASKRFSRGCKPRPTQDQLHLPAFCLQALYQLSLPVYVFDKPKTSSLNKRKASCSFIKAL
jgi:hypothetical protein